MDLEEDLEEEEGTLSPGASLVRPLGGLSEVPATGFFLVFLLPDDRVAPRTRGLASSNVFS